MKKAMKRVMNQEEKVSYLMLFCGLILVKHSPAMLEKLLVSIPLMGGAKSLAAELAGPIHKEERPSP